MVAFDFFFPIKYIFCNPVYWRQLYLLKCPRFFSLLLLLLWFFSFFFYRSEGMNEMNNKALIREKHSDDIY